MPSDHSSTRYQRVIAFTFALQFVIFHVACAKRSSVMRGVRAGHSETGVASWYGVPYHGRPTASGEIFDMREHTAAHRRLPFGTIARVENTRNGRATEVRINDRGPFVKGRFLDLSRAAADDIGMLRDGTAKVKLRVTRAPRANGVAVEAGVFSSIEEATRLRDHLHAKFPQAAVFYIGPSRQYRVLIPCAGRSEAEKSLPLLRREGVHSPLVVQLPAL